MADVTVTHSPEQERYVLTVDGDPDQQPADRVAWPPVQGHDAGDRLLVTLSPPDKVARVAQLLEGVLEVHGLGRAPRRHGGGVEEDHETAAAEVGERDVVAVLVLSQRVVEQVAAEYRRAGA